MRSTSASGPTTPTTSPAASRTLCPLRPSGSAAAQPSESAHASARPSRLADTRRHDSGRSSASLACPSAGEPGCTVNSHSSTPPESEYTDTGASRSGSATCIRRAAGPSDVPCTKSDTSTTANATLKSRSASGTPASSGKSASTMGTAPRSPVQPMKATSRRLNRQGARHNHTATGRATRIRKNAIASAGSSTAWMREGVTRRPSSRNMPDCASQAMPSMPESAASSRCPSRSASTTPKR